MPRGYHGRHRGRRALIIALAVVLALAVAGWVGGSMIQSLRMDDFSWGLGPLY